jgi:hypothetical protein
VILNSHSGKEDDDVSSCDAMQTSVKEIPVFTAVKGKAVPLHAMEELGGERSIAHIHSRPRH